jgi:hypothetical protein
MLDGMTEELDVNKQKPLIKNWHGIDYAAYNQLLSCLSLLVPEPLLLALGR